MQVQVARYPLEQVTGGRGVQLAVAVRTDVNCGPDAVVESDPVFDLWHCTRISARPLDHTAFCGAAHVGLAVEIRIQIVIIVMAVGIFKPGVCPTIEIVVGLSRDDPMTSR